MSINTLIKKVTSDKILLEYIMTEAKPTSVTGDEAAASGARGEMAAGRAKEIMARMGVNLPELDTIFSIQQLSVEPFKLSYVLQDLLDNPEELTLPKSQTFTGLARVVKDSNNLILEFKPQNSESTFLIKFTESNEVYTVLPGTKKKIIALAVGESEGKFYTVEFGPSFVTTIKSGDLETEGEEYKVGDTVDFTTDGGENGKGGITKIDGDNFTIGDGKGGTVIVNRKNIKKGGEDNNSTQNEKEGNFYNGKDLKEVNAKLSSTKDKARWFNILTAYKDDPEFQKIFLDAIIDGTKSIKINQQPLLTALKGLKSQGLLEAPTSMSGNQRKYLKVKLNLQNFMFDVFSIFAKVAKNGRNSQTFQVIKDFYKQLYFIATKGKTSIADVQTRKQLWKKLVGSFKNFLVSFSKLSEMIKGNGKQNSGKNVKVKNMPKASMSNTGVAEDFYRYISDNTELIFEADEDQKKSNTTAKIYLKGIVLGPKGKAKKDGDIETTYGGGGKGGEQGKPLTNTSMEDKKFYPVIGRLYDVEKSDTPSDLNVKEIINLFNQGDQNLEIRKSMSGDKGENFSIIIKKSGSGDGFLMVKPKDGGLINWTSSKPIDVLIGKKALGYPQEPFEGVLILKNR